MANLFDTAIKALGLGPSTPPVETLAAGKAELSAWLNSGGEPRWFVSRQDFAARFGQLLDNPSRVLQGTYPWCAPAAFLVCMLRRFPVTTTLFATGIYDRGEGSLGEYNIDVSSELKGFDLPKYATEQPYPRGRTRPVVYRSTDWILLAALIDGLSVFDFDGRLDDPSVDGPAREAAIGSQFEKTGLYATVNSRNVRGLPVDDFIATVNDPKTDVLLNQQVSFFVRDTISSRVGHVVAVLPPAEKLPDGRVKVSWATYGDMTAADLPPENVGVLEVIHDGKVVADLQMSDFPIGTSMIVATLRS